MEKKKTTKTARKGAGALCPVVEKAVSDPFAAILNAAGNIVAEKDDAIRAALSFLAPQGDSYECRIVEAADNRWRLVRPRLLAALSALDSAWRETLAVQLPVPSGYWKLFAPQHVSQPYEASDLLSKHEARFEALRSCKPEARKFAKDISGGDRLLFAHLWDMVCCKFGWKRDINAFKEMRAPEGILPDSKAEAEAEDEAEVLFFKNRTKFEALKSKKAEAKALALKLAGGDTSLAFRVWEVARRELKIKKIHDISKFVEV